MKRFDLVRLILLVLAFATPVFSQSTTTLSGTVTDQSGALIPSVEVRAVNDATGVETSAISNEAGVYNFLALQPGSYTVRATLPGFQAQSFTRVPLSANVSNRLNFQLQVAAQATTVDVSISADQLQLQSSASVGEALTAQEITALPNVTNNVLELINVMAGVTRQTGGFTLGVQGDFAGVPANFINVVRDGISVNDQRWQQAGLNSATYLNQDLVGEMRMILAPVDAETGRGNGQVQITTRSGGNEYHGAAVWNIRNSALDARTWTANQTAGGPPTRTWTNQNQYTLSFGGPIIENKTFFYALWDQNISKSRSTVQGQMLSPCMLKGIFRYYDNWNNGAANAVVNSGGTNPTRPSVDVLGNPLPPQFNPDGVTPHNQILRHVSLFGQVSGTPTPDCSGMTVSAAPTSSGAWDPLRTGFDTSGTFAALAARAPQGNSWEQVGTALPLDGLNVIGHRWTRTVDGRDNLYGVGEPNPRKQINAKIDHVFTQNHKLASSYSYESVDADDTYEGWPDSFEGRVQRRPQVLSVNMTSTLTPSIVNEGRFGMSRMGTNVLHATSVPGRGDALIDLLPKTTGGLPVLTQWCTPAGFFAPVAMSWCGENGGLVGARGDGPSATDTIDSSPRWTVSDTLSWSKGQHAFKFGATYVKATSKSETTGSSIVDHAFPVVFLGAAPLAPNNAFDLGNPNGWRAANPSLSPGLVTNNSNRMRDLLLFLNGSLGSIEQGRFINSPTQVGTAWNDPIAGDLVQIRDLQQHEFNFFFKDDWKLTKNLTLNLGMRWDYYGVPYDKNGLTMTIVGGGDSLFGRSGPGFENWFRPGERGQDVQFTFVGPNSPNPELRAHDRDLNNFGPAVGFSYTIPWLGSRQTILRGGYQLSFLGGGQGDQISTIIQNAPGSSTNAVFTGPSGGQYFNMQSVISGVGIPVQPTFLPVRPVPVTDRTVDITVFDKDYTTPYVQNLTLSVTHTLNSKVSVDVRYIGTLSRKLANTFNLNDPNIYQNGLFEALNAARAGGESTLLDTMFNGIDMRAQPFGPPQVVGSGGLTGAGFMRTDTRFSADLANGNYVPIANNLATLNYNAAINPLLPAIPSGSLGNVLRVRGFPENYIYTSPQFDDAQLRTNMGYRNYHSMQTQLTVRPIAGVQTSMSYTWAKDLGNTGGFGFGAGGAYTVPWDRARDYGLSGNSRAHTFRSYGTFNLPIGPNKLFLGNSSGALARAVEGWQMSWIYNLSSGAPLQIVSQRSGFYNNTYPVVVNSSLFDPKSGHVTWKNTVNGNYFDGVAYTQSRDPQCLDPTVVAASLQAQCTLNALYLNNELVFRTPKPGEFGNYKDQVFGPGRWDLDMSMSKNFRLNERFGLDVRVDATNVFNHPQPANPNLSIQGGGTFGVITSKSGTSVQFSEVGRSFAGRLRLSF
jgi:hypothetical protein